MGRATDRDPAQLDEFFEGGFAAEGHSRLAVNRRTIER
jgi:hypothetical protein